MKSESLKKHYDYERKEHLVSWNFVGFVMKHMFGVCTFATLGCILGEELQDFIINDE